MKEIKKCECGLAWEHTGKHAPKEMERKTTKFYTLIVDKQKNDILCYLFAVAYYNKGVTDAIARSGLTDAMEKMGKEISEQAQSRGWTRTQ